MTRERFEELVVTALEDLPQKFKDAMENIDVVIEDWPSRELLEEHGFDPDGILLGLYQGVPLTRRNTFYSNVLPDKITIFQKPIEAICHSETEIRRQVQETVVHEVAHYFGFDEGRLQELGWG